MITRIELTNFMSHVHTVIEPAAGLTVLVGPNNCGKSAVVAALQILCRNEKSTYVLRHGERECRVTIHCDDGQTIEWRRKSSPSYRINGQAFDRLGSSLPDELHQALRLPKVDAGDDSDYDVHFGAQKSPIFLLDGSPAKAARFFASSSDALRLVQMQNLHKKNLRDALSEKGRLEAESQRVNAELADLEPAIELDRRIKLLETEFATLLHRDEHIAGMGRITQMLQHQSSAVDRLAAESNALESLHPAPQLAPTAELEGLIVDLPAVQRRRDARAAESAALASLAAPPDLFDVAALQACSRGIASLEREVAATTARRKSLAGLTGVPQFAATDVLQTFIDTLTVAQKCARASAAQVEALAPLATPPALADELPLLRLRQELAECRRNVARHQERCDRLSRVGSVPLPIETAALAEDVLKLEAAIRQVQDSESQVQAATAELLAAEAALRTQAAGSPCPVCGTPLDPDRLVASTAAGGGAHAHG